MSSLLERQRVPAPSQLPPNGGITAEGYGGRSAFRNVGYAREHIELCACASLVLFGGFTAAVPLAEH
jgi:hypothetical protein